MSTIQALQHVYSSVERGYNPKKGRGFQTVALSRGLAGTPDLQALESASLYAAGRNSLDAEAPVKEVFFHLPSGRLAVGRTVDAGTDSLGREGNYLAHHLVVSREDLLKAGPFALLDGAPWLDGNADLEPRELPALTLETPVPEARPAGVPGVGAPLLGFLAATAVDGPKKPVLLIGDAARARRVLQWLHAALPSEERLGVTFSTHFYQCHELRSRFGFVTARSQSEAPSEPDAYTVIHLDEPEIPPLKPSSAYARWLSGAAQAEEWRDIRDLAAVVDAARAGGAAVKAWPSLTPASCAALWALAGIRLAGLLAGSPRQTAAIVRAARKSRPLAEALLAAGSPSALCGPGAPDDAVAACLSALHARAGTKAWREWSARWSGDPFSAAVAAAGKPWWRRVGRRK